jgi:PleD family two-component response regulator
VAELAAAEQGDALLRRVDKALFAAKQSGRNCVVAG